MDRHASSSQPIPLITVRPRIDRRTVKKVDTPRIKLSESSDQQDVKRHTVCLVCTSAVAPYTCPSFFCGRVERVLDFEKEEKRGNEVDGGEKKMDQKMVKMEEMLRRVLLEDNCGVDERQRGEEKEEEDDGGGAFKGSTISEERLEELLSLMEKWDGKVDESMVSSLLSDEELQRFHRAIASGLLSRLVSSDARAAPPWWFTCGSTERCIEVLSYGASASQYPGGCWCGDAWSAARDMVAVSPSLSATTSDPAGGDNIIYSGEEEVLIAVLERCKRELHLDAEFVLTQGLELLKPTSDGDRGGVKELLVNSTGNKSGGGTKNLVAVSAILDAKKMLEAAVAETVNKKGRKRLKPLARKLWFVTLWSAIDGGRKLGLLRGALEQARQRGTWKGPSQMKYDE